ncbi:Aste57867_16676 [Aphanomyces stellatus]|uniref:Aste57867_16676 protein n=1 Tax=Aphanomyces stellatus TaxID=120398 RepID=A0A485L775_9STRA|nr:hypothetical protein As57867_016619 [Aphanomyces stellatus]VFT93447.1 Aste57867_16676 [Aphanomyces stellatus]
MCAPVFRIILAHMTSQREPTVACDPGGQLSSPEACGGYKPVQLLHVALCPGCLKVGKWGYESHKPTTTMRREWKRRRVTAFTTSQPPEGSVCVASDRPTKKKRIEPTWSPNTSSESSSSESSTSDSSDASQDEVDVAFVGRPRNKSSQVNISKVAVPVPPDHHRPSRTQ